MPEPDRYFFCHLAKTGGVSLLTSLRKYFGADAVYPLPEHEGLFRAVWGVEFLQEVLDRQGDRIRVVTGHFPLCTPELLDGSYRTFTILRDPVERTLSHLRYQRLVDPVHAETTLHDVYAEPVNLFGNLYKYMVKMLSMDPEEITAGSMTFIDPQEAELQRAMANLEKVDVVGVLERYPLFHRTLETTFGWDLGEPLHANTTRPEEVSSELRAIIAADCALDARLYDFACHLVERRASSAR